MAAFDVEGGGELTALVPEIWDNDIEKYRYAKSVMLNRVSSKSDKVKAYGDTIHVFIKGRYTAADVTPSTGAFTAVSYTPTGVDLTVDKWKVVAPEVVNKATRQAIMKPLDTVKEEAAAAFSEQYDTDLLALGSSIAGVGSIQNPGVFNKDTALAMYIRLAKRNIPKEDLSWVLPVEAFWDGLAKQMEWSDASKTGLPKSILTTGFAFPILGIPAYESNLVARAGGNSNALIATLFHKSAYAIAMQLNNNYEMGSNLPAGRLSKTVAIDSLYGVKQIRGDHAVIGYVKEYVESQQDQ